MSLWCEGAGASCDECDEFDFLPTRCSACGGTFCWKHAQSHHRPQNPTHNSSTDLCESILATVENSRELQNMVEDGGIPNLFFVESETASSLSIIEKSLIGEGEEAEKNLLSFSKCMERDSNNLVVPKLRFLPLHELPPLNLTSPLTPLVIQSHAHSTFADLSIVLAAFTSAGSRIEDPAGSFQFSLVSCRVATYLSVGQAIERCLRLLWVDGEQLQGSLLRMEIFSLPDTETTPPKSLLTIPLQASRLEPLSNGSIFFDLVRARMESPWTYVLCVAEGKKENGENLFSHDDANLRKAFLEALFSRPTNKTSGAAMNTAEDLIRDPRWRSIRMRLLLRWRALGTIQLKKSKDGVMPSTAPHATLESSEPPEAPVEGIAKESEAVFWPHISPPPFYTWPFHCSKLRPIQCEGLLGKQSKVVLAVFVEDGILETLIPPACIAVGTSWSQGKLAQQVKETVALTFLKGINRQDPRHAVLMKLFQLFLLPSWGARMQEDLNGRCVSISPEKEKVMNLKNGDCVYLGLPDKFPRDRIRDIESAEQVLQLQQEVETANVPMCLPAAVVAELHSMNTSDVTTKKKIQKEVLMKCSIM